MRTKSTGGFTLIELLIVIAIIGILAAVLIPNLLSARSRAFDTAAQTCLKEIGTAEEVSASVDPWSYRTAAAAANAVTSPTALLTQDGTATTAAAGNGIQSCVGVVVTRIANASAERYGYTGLHNNGNTTYYITAGSGVTATPQTIVP